MTPELTAVIAIIIGLLMCFGGFKIQKLLITLVWFVIGAALAKYVGGYFIDNDKILIAVEIVVGIIVGSVGFKLEKLALFIAVAYLTFKTIGPYITGVEKGVALIIQGGIALFVGALSTFFIKPILIVVSSIAGASIIKSYIPVFVTLAPNVLLILIGIIAIMGILVQFKSN